MYRRDLLENRKAIDVEPEEVGRVSSRIFTHSSDSLVIAASRVRGATTRFLGHAASGLPYQEGRFPLDAPLPSERSRREVLL
jgi:hypothetical protein